MTSIRLDAEPNLMAVEGAVTGGEVSVIVTDTDEVGAGPRLHRHPYPETFVLVAGTVRFLVGDLDFTATAPSVQVAPANTAHRFEIVGPERVHMVDIHHSPHFVTEWLED